MHILDKEQAGLYQKRRAIKRSVGNFHLERYHWNYIISYVRKQRCAIVRVISLIFVQALIEIAALLFVDSSVRVHVYSALRQNELVPLLLLALCGASIYLIITYLSIKYERTAVLGLINDLRRRQFSSILSRQIYGITHETQARFIAKISYHLSLFSLGVDHSIFGSIRWILSVIILITLGCIAGGHMLVLLLAAVAASIGLAGIAYFVAWNYISQEVTAYSKIISHVSMSLSEFMSIKRGHLENQALDELDRRVAFDTYFRIRRDVWLRYFNRALFTTFFILSVLFFIFAFSHPMVTTWVYNPASTVFAGIISLYVVSLFYQAAQMGLYLLPARLGLFLSVPKQSRNSFAMPAPREWHEIMFKSNKTKLFAEGGYLKDVSITINRGKKYLFIGGARNGKTSLASVFAGTPEFNPAGWLVKIDAARHDMRFWTEAFTDRYFFGPSFTSEKTLGELILGKETHAITGKDINLIYSLCERYPLFSSILSKKRFIGESAATFQKSDASLFAIQALHCIVKRTGFIIIDNHWTDLSYPEIEDMIRILKTELPESAMMIFARHTNEIVNYDASYEIQKQQIQVL